MTELPDDNSDRYRMNITTTRVRIYSLCCSAPRSRAAPRSSSAASNTRWVPSEPGPRRRGGWRHALYRRRLLAGRPADRQLRGPGRRQRRARPGLPAGGRDHPQRSPTMARAAGISAARLRRSMTSRAKTWRISLPMASSTPTGGPPPTGRCWRWRPMGQSYTPPCSRRSRQRPDRAWCEQRSAAALERHRRRADLRPGAWRDAAVHRRQVLLLPRSAAQRRRRHHASPIGS